MASSVATPLERRLGAIADVDDMTSTSSVGSTNIQLTFGLGRDIDGAARDVQAAIVAARADLPTALTRTPQYRKINSSSFPVLQLAMTSDVLSQAQIFDAADALVSQRLSQIKGVGSVNVSGSALPAVRVEINPLALSKYGIGLQDVRAAISNANANAPKGAIESGSLHYQVYTNDNARDAALYRSLVIASRNGATVRLGDVAVVRDVDDGATENIRTFGLYNGKPAVQVQISQQPDANIIATVDEIRAALPQLRAAIDPKIDVAVTNDRSVTIRASLRQVERTLLLAVAMVILVVYLFLRSPRAALIPAVVVPVSLVGTFGAMYLLGFSLNNFSLMALTIATGFVVDDGRVHPLPDGRRHRRPAVPRVHRHALGIDPDLARHLADHHADDVRTPARPRCAAECARLGCGHRPRLRPPARGLRAHAGLGARSRSADDAAAARHHRVERVPVHRGAQGLHAAAGHRAAARWHPR
jgi:multidrug efflux pump